MKLITVSSLKGGVGKTTLAIFLGLAKVRDKKRVLFVDADPNNNLTDFFLRDSPVEDLEKRNLFTVLNGLSNLPESISSPLPGVSILPATPTLARAQIEFANDPGTMIRFHKSLSKLDFDFVFWDTPPALSFELFLALHGSNRVLCPVGFSRWTIQGFDLLASACVRADAPPPLGVPVAVTKKDIERIRETGLGNLSENFVPKSAQFSRAVTLGKSLPANSELWAHFKGLGKEL